METRIGEFALLKMTPVVCAGVEKRAVKNDGVRCASPRS
jgi:hypothetical protein